MTASATSVGRTASLAVLPDEGAPRFQGMWREPDGLYYVRARNYDPETGRFLSRDPEEGNRVRPETYSPTAFAASNPYLFSDATGRFPNISGLSAATQARFALAATAIANVGRSLLAQLNRWRDVISRFRSPPLPRVVIDPSKWRFIFGDVASNAHNAARSLQNARVFGRIGVRDTAAGRSALLEHFRRISETGANILRVWSTDHGTFLERESLFFGPGGVVKLNTTWQLVGRSQRLVTIIPRSG